MSIDHEVCRYAPRSTHDETGFISREKNFGSAFMFESGVRVAIHMTPRRKPGPGWGGVDPRDLVSTHLYLYYI